MCWWFLCYIKHKVRQTGLPFSFFFFPGWYFGSKDSVGIRYWGSETAWAGICSECHHPSTLPCWEVGTALPDFQFPATFLFVAVAPSQEGGTCVRKLSCCQFTLSGLGRLACFPALWTGDTGAEQSLLVPWHLRELTLFLPSQVTWCRGLLTMYG